MESTKLSEVKSQEVDDLPVFSIPVVEVVSNANNVHTENNLKNPWQRGTAIERNNGRISVSCVCKDVVHGFYSEPDEDDDEDDQPPQHCSLIVLHFRFDPVDLGRRIKKVQTTIRFSAINEDDEDPVVDRISPDGFFWVYPTTQKETVTAGGLVKAGGSALGAELGGELKREKVVEREVTSAGTVRGAVETVGRNRGDPNAASWTLMENPTDKTGAPVSLRAAVLVRRDPGINFQAHFSMLVTPDNLTQAQTWFKSNPKDDPVLYKVDKGPTNKLHNYRKETIDGNQTRKLVDNLGRLNLDSPEFSDITLRTVWKQAEKGT
ncbi:hypothetical protein QBC47DRAFT_377372 [Echria macrotheca]|uniref:Uncharacterized protein n=1 Tax=Echria macrotheca TaxID=438768 RepID=A0AAJ0BGE4_9PEZI|nr:hypothetical protein QBC47DRAFT_377372 [Echria macrotheca]